MSKIHSLKNPHSESYSTFMTEEELATHGLWDVVKTAGYCVLTSETGKRHVWYVDKHPLCGDFNFHRLFKARRPASVGALLDPVAEGRLDRALARAKEIEGEDDALSDARELVLKAGRIGTDDVAAAARATAALAGTEIVSTARLLTVGDRQFVLVAALIEAE